MISTESRLGWRTGAALAALATITTISASAEETDKEIESLVTEQAETSDEAAGVTPKSDWLSQFYAEENARPIWTDSRRAERRRKDYLALLENATAFGLNPADYGLKEIKKRLETNSEADKAALDLIISKSFANFALDIRDGAASPRIDFTEEELAGRETTKKEILAALTENRNINKFVKTLRRDNPVQQNLISALRHYETLIEDGGWERVEISSDKMEEGYSGDDVLAVAERLKREGFFTGEVALTSPEPAQEGAAEPTPIYDARIAKAVEQFQKSRGIAPDGIVGPNTLERLNETPEELVDSIKLNLERARWLPQEFGDRYVLVNIARYTAGVYENEKLQNEIRAIVGKYHNQTPVFAGSMSYVVVNPYWNIPESIVRGEIAPQVANNPDYLAEKNMEAVSDWSDDAEIVASADIDWENLPSPLNFRLRQKPGKTNSLGLIKFMFPNDYSVYLHDTPADSLFDEPKRAFSHGCIRLGDPLAMADWVLRETKEASRSKVEEIIESGEKTIISLDAEIPVYITYFTAWADESGNTYFLDDVYDRDGKLRTALAKNKPDYSGGALTALP